MTKTQIAKNIIKAGKMSEYTYDCVKDMNDIILKAFKDDANELMINNKLRETLKQFMNRIADGVDYDVSTGDIHYQSVICEAIQAEYNKRFNSPAKEDVRKHALGLINDVLSNYFYYDRKEDEMLSPSEFENYIETGVITKKEIADEFVRLIMIDEPKKEMVKLKIFSADNPDDYELVEVTKEFYDKYNEEICTGYEI